VFGPSNQTIQRRTVGKLRDLCRKRAISVCSRSLAKHVADDNGEVRLKAKPLPESLLAAPRLSRPVLDHPDRFKAWAQQVVDGVRVHSRPNDVVFVFVGF
jgi:hypothetical protein